MISHTKQASAQSAEAKEQFSVNSDNAIIADSNNKLNDNIYGILYAASSLRVERLKASAIRMADIPDYEPANWLIKKLLENGQLSVVYGSPGSGKSFIVLDLAIHIANGKEWFGRTVDQGAVAYFALEGASGVKKRLRAYRKHYDGTMESDAFVLFPTAIDLCGAESDADAIAEAAMGLASETGQPLRLIVIDTLNRAIAGGDENSSKDMGSLVANADRIREATGAHVLIIHHSGKNGENGARGHSSLKGAVDTELEVTSGRRTAVRTLRVTKQKDGPEDFEINFQLHPVTIGEDEDGEEETSCVVERAHDTTSDINTKTVDKGPAHADAALDSLKALSGEAKLSDWQEAFYTKLPADMKRVSKRSAFSRAKKWLIDTGKIIEEGDQVRIVMPEAAEAGLVLRVA